MAWTRAANGSQSCTVSTGHDLTTQTAAGVYQLYLKTVGAMANAATEDVLQVQVYVKHASGGSEHIVLDRLLRGEQVEDFCDFPRAVVYSIRYRITQTQGGTLTIAWDVAGNTA